MKWCLALAVCLFGANAHAEDEFRVAVVIGSNIGNADEAPLEYAEADAERFHALLLELGHVAPSRAYLVTSGGAETARRALVEARGRLQELRARGRTVLIVYISSHADERAVHLAGSELPIAEIRAFLSDAPADLRLGIVDACRTKVPLKAKGGKPGPEVRVSAERPSRVEGSVLVLAAGEGEPAQEWGSLRGSLFTHHFLAGLRGLADANTDGEVTLAETYSYAFGKTASGSVSAKGGVQRPSFDMAIAGWGDWVFTVPVQLGASLTLGRELEGTYWLIDARQELVAEIAKRRGERTTIGLTPGWYRLIKPDGEFADATDLNLAWSGSRIINALDLSRVPLRRVTLRGSEPIQLRPFRVSVFGLVGAGPLGETQGGFGASVSREWGAWFARFSAEFGTGGARYELLSMRESEVAGRLGVGRTFRIWVALVTVGVDVRLSYIVQRVTRVDADTVQRVFGRSEPSRSAFAPAGDVSLGVLVPLSEAWWVDAELTLGLQSLALWSDTSQLAIRPQGRLGLGFAF